MQNTDLIELMGARLLEVREQYISLRKKFFEGQQELRKRQKRLALFKELIDIEKPENKEAA